MQKISVHDDYLSPEAFQEIKKIMSGPDFPWYFNKEIIGYEDGKDTLDNYQFTHLFYSKGIVMSGFYNAIVPLMEKINPFAMVRIKANLMTRTEKNIISGFHTDFNHNFCTTAIYYINNNDGYTIFDNGKKIESVENRLVSFNSTVPHSGTTCTNKKSRILININYIENKNL